MPEHFVIRPATRADVPVVLGLIRELAEFEKLSHLLTTTEDTLAAELFGPGSPAEVLIGEAGGHPVAYSVTFHNFSTFLGRKGMYLEDLYVRQSERRKGYGRAMLLHIAKLAKERGCGRFEWTVLDWNTPAIRFYEGLGASILHEWKLVRVTGDALTRMAAMR
jgi:GNAT superfamily N-acetyltransferase